jgi:hypothetical protein
MILLLYITKIEIMKVLHGLGGIAGIATIGLFFSLSGDPIEAENTFKDNRLSSSDEVLFDNLGDNPALEACIGIAEQNKIGIKISGLSAKEFIINKCSNQINSIKITKQ